jgi:hypothetical protein
VRLLAFNRIDSVELGHQHFAWLQAIGHRSSVEQARFAQHGARARIERIEAHRHGLVLGGIVVDQNDESVLRLPRIGGIETRQNCHRRRRSGQAANGLRRPAATLKIGCPLSNLVFDVGGKSFRQEQAVGRGNGELQCTTSRGGIGRQAARFRDNADDRRDAGK